jgi:hypothetical protein
MPDDLDLSTLTVRPIFASERDRWQRVMVEDHYLRSNRMVGEQLRQVAVTPAGTWVACLGWCAGCRHLSGREEWLGWSDGQRAMRLHLTVNNARFCVLGTRGAVPNLASRVLALALARLSRDWEEAYGHPVLVAETFVDLERRRPDGSVEVIDEAVAGTCYRAAGFVASGLTRGFRRVRGGFERHGQRRLLLLREVVSGARAMLTDQMTPWDRAERAAPAQRLDLLSLPGAFDPERGLIAHLVREVPDPRQVRQYSWRCILAGLLGGVLAGKQTMKDIAAWARSLPPEAIERLGGRWKGGKRSMPCANTYGYALEHADLERLNTALRAWLTAQGIDWSGDIIAVDGKALVGASAGRTGAALATASAFAVTGRAVLAMAMHQGDERKAVRTCLRQLDLRGCTVTGDALFTNADFVSEDIVKKGVPTSSRSRPTSASCWLRPSASTGRRPPEPKSSPARPATAAANNA